MLLRGNDHPDLPNVVVLANVVVWEVPLDVVVWERSLVTIWERAEKRVWERSLLTIWERVE